MLTLHETQTMENPHKKTQPMLTLNILGVKLMPENGSPAQPETMQHSGTLFPGRRDDINPPTLLLTMFPRHINNENIVNVQHRQKCSKSNGLPRSSTFTHTKIFAILKERIFLGGNFALLEATFGVGLHCRVDDLMLPYPLPPMGFCMYITMHLIQLFVGRRRLYGEAEEKGQTFSQWQKCAMFTYLLGNHDSKRHFGFF